MKGKAVGVGDRYPRLFQSGTVHEVTFVFMACPEPCSRVERQMVSLVVTAWHIA
jgi:hypothetical protein